MSDSLNVKDMDKNGTARSFWPAVFLNLLASMATPFILFISTTNSLYLGNQEDLGHQLHVLYPFWGMFAGGTLFGLLLFAWEKRQSKRLLYFFCWAFLLVGPTFLIFDTLHARYTHLTETGLAIGSIIILWLLASWLLAKQGVKRSVKGFFAVLFLLLMAFEGWKFFSEIHSAKPAAQTMPHKEVDTAIPMVQTMPPQKMAPAILPAQAQPPIKPAENSHRDMPNVYHIVFDAFQSDWFKQTLTPQIEAKLSEFRFFCEATTPFGLTLMSLAATFSGKPYDYNQPQIDYIRDAFTSKQSFLFSLNQAGYDSMAIVHPIYAFKLTLLQQVIPLKQYTNIQFIQDNWVLFRNLWLYSRLPKRIAGQIVPSEDLQHMEKGNLLPDVAPIYSYYAFQKFLKEEENKQAHNRYSFIHLILPHFPKVLRADGTYGPPLENGDMPQTSTLEQAQCATNMIVALAERLKELKRFGDSLIIIQGDHGDGYGISEKELAALKGLNSSDWHWSRSRPLLLLKLASGKDKGKSFQTFKQEVTLLDIAPTVLDSLDLSEDNGRFTGISLAQADLPQTRGKRIYHHYVAKGWHGWTDTLERYSIENGMMKREADVHLTNNPKILPEDFK